MRKLCYLNKDNILLIDFCDDDDVAYDHTFWEKVTR